MTPRVKTWVELVVGLLVFLLAAFGFADYVHKADWFWAAGALVGGLWSGELIRRSWLKL